MTNKSDIVSLNRLSGKVVYENPWIRIHEDKTINLDGREGIYGYMESRDSCMIVVVDDQDRICFVRGYRYPSKTFGWELPGGGGDNEDFLVASKRELEEETGILAETWTELGKAYVCNGLMTEKMAVVLAKNLSFMGKKEESNEVFSDISFFNDQKIDEMIKNGEINDCQTLAGLHYYQIHKKEVS